MSGGELIEQPAGPPTSASADQTLLDIISRAASDPNVDVEKLERLTALYERHLEREARAAYRAALAQMQPELPEIKEAGEIQDKAGEVQSTYALWEDTQAAIKPVLAKHGFALTFRIEKVEAGMIVVVGRLSHRLGHVEESPSPSLPADTSGSKNAVQAWGSSTSYGMRYAAKALLNLTSRGEDDDGVAGGTKLINEGQREALTLLAQRARVEMVRFCARLGVPSLDQLPYRRYREAEKALQEAINRRDREAQR